jgi:hypothetical protein
VHVEPLVSQLIGAEGHQPTIPAQFPSQFPERARRIQWLR